MKYTLTEHAKKVLTEREIPVEWLDRVLDNPMRTEVDPLMRRYSVTIGRSLRMAHACSA
jgi:hypothetical protein